MMSLPKTSLCNGALSAWLVIVAFGCSGNTSLGGASTANIGGAMSTGGKPSTGGTTSTSTYQPCAGKQCGDSCTICPPNSSGCIETAIVKTCSLSGECRVGTQQCTTTSGGSSNVGGGSSSSSGGSSSTATGSTCTLMECFRAVDCVAYCGGPVLSSSCCACAAGTFDDLGCTSSSGGSSSTGGTSSTSTYVPCAGKQCGDACTLCDPKISGCGETAVLKFCNLAGTCDVVTPQCPASTSGGAPSTGGAASTGGSTATGGICATMECFPPSSGGASSAGGAPSTGGVSSGVKCGAAVCGATEDCCNASCSLCVPKGNGCITMVCTTGGSTSVGGATGAGGTTSITGLHTSCTNGTCPEGLTPVEYYGEAGTAGPLFCSCEIPCATATTGTSTARSCPTGMQCTTVSDGPGTVCY